MEELNYHVDFGPFYVHLTQKQKRYLAVRSVIDRILAALALIVLSPLFLVVSVAQKISAPDEPIFFLQKRVGRGAHCFNIIKFRTMKSSAPKNVATGDLESPETYISRLGRFLRDTSIDELPQFVNVVRGEMSLIGPRPLVYRFKIYSSKISNNPSLNSAHQCTNQTVIQPVITHPEERIWVEQTPRR